ncbi:MAG: hypothetical protein KGI50_06590 [Patescibacteria group bacterium]|nr:hypothetical protein [Patescibacteria group bacterium]MDE2439120.1 hypothetical protein [Patescibacteria group bacterium]
MSQITIKKPDGTEITAEVIPYSTEDERFSIYAPNVKPDHPLYGKIVKVKTAVTKIAYLGENPDTGVPMIQIWQQTLVDVE